MRDVRNIIRDRQLAIRRELDRRGKALKVIAYDSGIEYDTLISYFPGGDRKPAELPSSALYSLCGIIPDDLMNLLCPEGYAIVQVPHDTDFDAINQHCMDFLAEKAAAHHPDSEAGVAIGPGEQDRLASKVVRLRA